MKTLFAILLLLAVPAMAAEIYNFSVLPSGGSIEGQPGSTIGWGYSIQNQSTSSWLVTTGMDTGLFQHGTPDLLFDFPAIAPGGRVTVPFNAAGGTGLLAFLWNNSAPAGFVNSGQFVLTAQWWNGDPLGGGRLQFAASDSSQPYSATVSAAAVPEPKTSALIALPLLVFGTIGVMRQRRQRVSQQARTRANFVEDEC